MDNTVNERRLRPIYGTYRSVNDDRGRNLLRLPALSFTNCIRETGN